MSSHSPNSFLIALIFWFTLQMPLSYHKSPRWALYVDFPCGWQEPVYWSQCRCARGPELQEALALRGLLQAVTRRLLCLSSTAWKPTLPFTVVLAAPPFRSQIPSSALHRPVLTPAFADSLLACRSWPAVTASSHSNSSGLSVSCLCSH